mgnify:CR=1 FL=1
MADSAVTNGKLFNELGFAESVGLGAMVPHHAPHNDRRSSRQLYRFNNQRFHRLACTARSSPWNRV